MDAAYFATLQDYGEWMRSRVLEQVALLKADEYTAIRLPNGGSLRSILVHALGADEYWLARLSADASWSEMPSEQDVPAFDDLVRRWSELDAKAQAFFIAVADVDLNTLLTYASARSPREFTNPLWAVMTQRAGHHHQHLTEVAMALAGMGYSTGDLDFILYMSLRSGGG